MSPLFAEAVAAAEKLPLAEQDALAAIIHDRVRENAPTPAERAEKFASLLRRWREEGDDEERQDTLDALIKGLNETRSEAGARLHFPPELKGKTW